MSARGSRTGVALALQLAALLALGLSLLGHAWLDPRSKPRLLLLVDRSDSMPQADSDQAVADVVRAAKAAGQADPQRIAFAGRPAGAVEPGTASVADLEPSATNIEAALQAALAAHAEAAFERVVVVSDGQETAGDAARALRAVREAGLPLQWVAIGRAPPPARVAEVLAPDRALVGQTIQLTVQLAGSLDRPLRVKASVRSPGGETQVARSEAIGAGRVTLEFDARRSGAVLVDVALEDAASGRLLDAVADAAVIDVAPRAAVLYAQGSTAPLARSLLRGGWSLTVVASGRLDEQADALAGYQAVVLDDVAIADAGPRFWAALVAAVKDRGLGLMVLGGERSFARGGYRGSVLESVLPVVSEPAALDQPAAVVFAVDKSGSMGRGSGGVDRFALAQRAVLETARGLGERDSLGLVVFDAAPRLLIPLGPAATGIAALARDWQARPNGGTRLAPALDMAIGELERASAARRMLILVTDGFIDGAPLADLRARLDGSHIETIALAVGPDADASALERIVGTEAGLVLRVDQAAELPLAMRSGLERRRARVERGSIAVTQVGALPFPPGTLKGWPSVAAHAVTRAQAGAAVAVQSQRGEPLIAFQNAGRGRVVALTGGLGPWTPQWLQWREWPRLAGGLADWTSGAGAGAAVALAVSDLPGGLQVEADSAAIAVDTPSASGRVLPTDPIAPGRWRATLPEAGPGLYSFVLTTPLGSQRQLHLRRQRAEQRTWGINPALQAWTSAGLVSAWEPGSLAQPGGGERGRRPFDRSLIGLALVLFLSGVVVDRTTWPLTAPGGLSSRSRRTRLAWTAQETRPS